MIKTGQSQESPEHWTAVEGKRGEASDDNIPRRHQFRCPDEARNVWRSSKPVDNISVPGERMRCTEDRQGAASLDWLWRLHWSGWSWTSWIFLSIPGSWWALESRWSDQTSASWLWGFWNVDVWQSREERAVWPGHRYEAEVPDLALIAVLPERLGEELGTDTGPAAGPVGLLHVLHHQPEEGVAGWEWEGVVGDGHTSSTSLHCDVLVLTQVVQHHIVSVEVETTKPPHQQHSEGVRQVDHRVGACLVCGLLEKTL